VIVVVDVFPEVDSSAGGESSIVALVRFADWGIMEREPAEGCGGLTGVSVFDFLAVGVLELSISALSSSISAVDSLFRLRAAAVFDGDFDVGVSAAPLLPAPPSPNNPFITLAASAIFRADSSASTAANFANVSFLAFFCSLSFIPLFTIGSSSSSSKTSSTDAPLAGAVALPLGSHERSNG
jgi:hypothetical protein